MGAFASFVCVLSSLWQGGRRTPARLHSWASIGFQFMEKPIK